MGRRVILKYLNTMIKKIIKLGSILFAASLAQVVHAEPERPNIVVFLGG